MHARISGGERIRAVKAGCSPSSSNPCCDISTVAHHAGCCLVRRAEELATLREELQAQCALTLEACKGADAAGAELAAAQMAAEAAGQERAAVEARLAASQAVLDRQQR